MVQWNNHCLMHFVCCCLNHLEETRFVCTVINTNYIIVFRKDQNTSTFIVNPSSISLPCPDLLVRDRIIQALFDLAVSSPESSTHLTTVRYRMKIYDTNEQIQLHEHKSLKSWLTGLTTATLYRTYEKYYRPWNLQPSNALRSYLILILFGFVARVNPAGCAAEESKWNSK